MWHIITEWCNIYTWPESVSGISPVATTVYLILFLFFYFICNHFLWKIFKLCNSANSMPIAVGILFFILPTWMFYRLEVDGLFSTGLLSCCYLEQLANSVRCLHLFQIQCLELCFVLSLVSITPCVCVNCAFKISFLKEFWTILNSFSR